MSESNHKRILIVGGVAGGASAAARARRLSEDVEIVMFERGDDVSFANCGLPYYIGGTIEERKRLLVQTPESFRRRYRVDARTRCEVIRIDRESRQVIVRDRDSQEETAEAYDALILSPGAEPVRPRIPGAASPGVFTLRSLADTDRIKQAVDQLGSGRAVIVGAGYIGLEMAEALRDRGIEVTLVELAKQVFIAADPEMVAPIHQQLRFHGVDLRLGTSVTAIAREGDRLGVLLSDGESVEGAIVILAVGVRPETTLARECGLEIGPTGGIAVDRHMRTSDPNIFAVGDAVEVNNLVGGNKALIPLAGPANRQGRIAADNALGRKSVYKDSQGTAICKVFDLAIGMTGMSEKALKRAGMAYEKVYVHPSSHAAYYPGAMPLSLKLLFHPETGRVLGAQAVGADGVDKRIDVLAVAIRAGLGVRDLADEELCYAPPYGSARDPINYAGFVATNVLDGDARICHTEDVIDPAENQWILDVRNPDELLAGTVPGAKNIPLDQLRERLDEVPRDKEILAFCQAGLRGYLACRILSVNGFSCRNLSGGYKTYQAAVGQLPMGEAAPREMHDDADAEPPPARDRSTKVVKEVDARSLQCPGPIMRLREELDGIDVGQALAITAADPGFPADVVAWCHSTGNELLEVAPTEGACRATIVKRPAPRAAAAPAAMSKKKTIVVFSGDFDKAMAAFIIANGAAAMGSDVTMFFTFWGLNVIRRAEPVAVQKNLVERMFGRMMPRGADRLGLSKMHLGGMGLAMIKGIMRKKNVDSLPDLIEKARAAGVRLVACSMSMDLMGIRREELLDGVEEGGVATYLQNAEAGSVNLFI
jgi:NADPH-dependent 2,4-dienoyl-CoA reductase/sulfur reductase-like enzyme/peroxiredoxin family protein/rhodanese-related sulfurtransferase/TusA-related sulfurtransferase